MNRPGYCMHRIGDRCGAWEDCRDFVAVSRELDGANRPLVSHALFETAATTEEA